MKNTEERLYLERNGTMKLTNDEIKMCFAQIKSHTEALKNCIATAVELNEFDRAITITKELREYQVLYSKLNMQCRNLNK